MLQDGCQAIHIATRKGHIEIVEFLLDEKGVSPRIHAKVHINHCHSHTIESQNRHWGFIKISKANGSRQWGCPFLWGALI